MMRARLTHAARMGVLVCLLWCLPSPHRSGELVSVPTRASVQSLVPSVHRLSDSVDQHGGWAIADAEDRSLGSVIRTRPAADTVAGYRGPTEALIWMDSNDTVQKVMVLDSHDTGEHVAEVEASPEFLSQFAGLTWGGKRVDGREINIDGVSGATLTSLAMAGGILKRLGENSQSLLFCDPVTMTEVQTFFPDATTLSGQRFTTAHDASGKHIGTVIATGSWVDDEVGYQGPTECLVAIDESGRLRRPRIRRSFDNETYVDYVRQERSFWKKFEGMTLEQVAAFDPEASGVEGVSGATMTSMAIAYSLPRFATELLADEQWLARDRTPWQLRFDRVRQSLRSIRWSSADLATLATLMMLPWLVRFGGMRHRMIRRAWLIGVFILIGLFSGNLLSLALLAGWATSGVMWQFAIGLISVAIVAIAIPPMRRGNPYCNHLCPHGAVQQLVRPTIKSKRKRRLPAWWKRWLSMAPAITLLLVYLTLLFRPASDVSFVEPFHGYLWQVASWSALAWTLITMVVSTFIPMAYCRLGCPTGRLLEFLRFNSNRHQITRFDVAMILLLVATVGYQNLFIGAP